MSILQQPNDILIDVDKTLNMLKEKGKRISWSKLSQFTSCQATWFSRNIASFPIGEQSFIENNWSIQGTLLQKLMEVFINERVYREIPNRQDQIAWLKSNSENVFNLIHFPLAEQFTLENPRHFFETEEGKARIQKQLDLGMDSRLKGFEPQFVNLETFLEKRESLEVFLKENNELYAGILKEFDKWDIDLDHMISEQYIEITIPGDVTLNGSIDFIYNKHSKGGDFNSLDDLLDNFIVLDGKYRDSQYVKSEQLDYYAALLHLKYKKVASFKGFFIWKEGKIKKMKPFDPNYVKKLMDSVRNISIKVDQLIYKLENIKDKGLYSIDGFDSHVIRLTDLPEIGFTASVGNCSFCNINKMCASCNGQTWENFAKMKQNKKILSDHLESLNYVSGGIQEISI